MNLLARAKSSANLIFPYHSSRKCLLFSHPITSLQQSMFYSTRTAYNTPKTEQSSKPRTQKSSGSSLSFSQGVQKQAEALTVWPRPREIPYQKKVANFVNIIGYVKIPVKFEAGSDGKHWAATVISQELGDEMNSLLIPVVFEGDLAHVVACHVKENDCIFVSGQLSVDPMRLVLSESLGKFHVVAENLNFVEGLKRNVLNYATKKKGVLTSSVEIDKPISPVAKKLGVKLYSDGSGGDSVDKDESFNKKWRDVLEHAKTKRLLEKNEGESSNSVEDSAKMSINTDSKAAASVQLGNDNETVKDKSKPEKSNQRSGETAGMKKDADSWSDLVINPLQWWDYRKHKSNGLVKAKFPDFKHKETNASLWLSSAPKWMLAELKKLEFDVKFVKTKQVQVGEGLGERKTDDKRDDSWKNLVENPHKWWDNRSNKRYPNSADFKHKDTGEVLWLNKSPDWAVSRLSPLKISKILHPSKGTF